MAPVPRKNANGQVGSPSLETSNDGLAENATENVVALGSCEHPVVVLGGVDRYGRADSGEVRGKQFKQVLHESTYKSVASVFTKTVPNA